MFGEQACRLGLDGPWVCRGAVRRRESASTAVPISVYTADVPAMLTLAASSSVSGVTDGWRGVR
jgi:hypothetical protein